MNATRYNENSIEQANCFRKRSGAEGFSMSYQALYRKFRPRRFCDVIGQDHITTILKNQVRTGQFAHAYLFSGSRGTGKTSIAKIFARAINCLSPQDGEPCGVCEACRYSQEEETVDIIEMDAASNTGVDDMRALLEKARFTPLHLKYKVYIIDEVHMLSTSASNALLKTLEEPPAHIVFLLATTEPQKLLATVVSRCQRFDFHRLAIPDIVRTMKDVFRNAGVQMDDGGLLAIARAADGGMRDALSLADQCLAFCGDHLSEQDVYDVLGYMQAGFLFDMADALLRSDAPRALRLLDNVVRGGRDIGVFTQDIAQHVRALLLAKTCGDCMDLLDCTPDAMARYVEQAQLSSQARLLRTMELLTKVQSDMKWLRQPRALLETMLVRICRPEDEHSLLALEDRLSRLEKAAANGIVCKAPERPVDEQAVIAVPADDIPYEAPPWDDLVPPPVLEEAPFSDSIANSRKPIPAPPPTDADASVQNDPLWDSMLKAMRTQNMAVYVLANSAQRVFRSGNTLTIVFAPSKEPNMMALRVPKNTEYLNNLIKSLDESLQIHFCVETPRSDDPQTQELFRFFGDKLHIENGDGN